MYSPQRPEVDVAEVFLWLMAVGTILCASYWSAWSAREAAIEHDKLVKVTLFNTLNLREISSHKRRKSKISGKIRLSHMHVMST